jgi:transcription-repair coupling factor (superfamily II helicase)
VQKYSAAEEDEVGPQLSKLGGAEWTNRVNKAKNAAKKLAVDLAALYAERASAVGFAFSKDTAWQRTFEERFPYELTPDQKQSIQEIKADMEQVRPMDRLLCGDVGYGKTELALRAIFKAIQDGKQAALLVPTTILAQQHYNTMCSRFADFPVKMAALSRFQTPKEREAVKEALAKGQIDVVVGTHALLAKDVKYKALGLLVIDEEHRFGVNHKEQIKAMKKTVDVLTLTATPIPRTLNMSMTGIRDISVIETPPRRAIQCRPTCWSIPTRCSRTRNFPRNSREKGRRMWSPTASSAWIRPQEAGSARAGRRASSLRTGRWAKHSCKTRMLDFLVQRYDVLLCSTSSKAGSTSATPHDDRFGGGQDGPCATLSIARQSRRSNRIGYAYFTVQTGRVMNKKRQSGSWPSASSRSSARGSSSQLRDTGDSRRGIATRRGAARTHHR